MRIPSSAVSFLRSRVINSSSKRVPRRSVSNPAQDGFDVLYDQEGSFMIKGMLSAGLCSAIVSCSLLHSYVSYFEIANFSIGDTIFTILLIA